jgi:hypothetical protein
MKKTGRPGTHGTAALFFALYPKEHPRYEAPTDAEADVPSESYAS